MISPLVLLVRGAEGLAESTRIIVSIVRRQEAQIALNGDHLCRFEVIFKLLNLIFF